MKSALKEKVCHFIDQKREELNDLSNKIWNHPELGYEEKYAHEQITSYLERNGFEVTRHTPLETSFIAKSKESKGPIIGIICEYDALPGIGHACGHNLIAEAGVAAGLAVKAALTSEDSEYGLNGQVIVYGAPAEEGGGGKVMMIEKGCFKEIDVCMMVHPSRYNVVDPLTLTIESFKLTYLGKASHAAAAPWEGVNALDAAVACYTSVSMLRQQVRPSCRIHAIFTDGGQKPNIIPRRAQLEYYIRTETVSELKVLKDKVMACAKGAASATGCDLSVEPVGFPYLDLCTNSALADCYRRNAEELGIAFVVDLDEKRGGSTDMGNVSHLIPSVHPKFAIPSSVLNHTEEFAEAAGSVAAQEPTLIAAKAMAMTCVDVLCDEGLLDRIKHEFGIRQ